MVKLLMVPMTTPEGVRVRVFSRRGAASFEQAANTVVAGAVFAGDGVFAGGVLPGPAVFVSGVSRRGRGGRSAHGLKVGRVTGGADRSLDLPRPGKPSSFCSV